ncbi:MAG: hypothetical protein RL033_4916 [Pseudomonadota bacterium]
MTPGCSAPARRRRALLYLVAPLLAAPLLPAPPASAALPGSERPTPVASYTLHATLDAAKHEIHGRGEIVWLNSSTKPVTELYLHLYLNAFDGPRTLFHRSPVRQARGGKQPKRWGSIRLERLVARELGEQDLLPALEPHSPGDAEDGTDRRVALPAAVNPGERLTLAVEWTSVLPEVQVRTGFSEDFHLAGQWFPKLARLEPDGSWAHFPFDPLAEFYADFGSYDVTVDVPDDMIVGATGQRVAETREGGRHSLRFHAEDVHDFAWTAWPHFRERQEQIAGIDVRLLYPPGHDQNATRTIEVLRRALPHFSARYGPYPYPNLTVVHPPEYAGDAGGMEYPTLITTGGAWHLGYWTRAIEFVTVHELGHQWFYGLLASDEHRWPFLDEGLNSYAESVALTEFFGTDTGGTVLGFPLSSEALRRLSMLVRPHDVPIALAASEFPSMADVGSTVYQRTALLFQTIANVYGKAELEQGLRNYALRYRFRHPTPEDLLSTLAESLPAGALHNLRAALFEGHGVDYQVSSVETATALRDIPAPGAAPTTPPAPASREVESRVFVSRHGQLQFPVQVLLTFQTGQQIMENWDGAGTFRVFTQRGPSPVVSAVVDPERRVLLDENLLNNALSERSDAPLGLFTRGAEVWQWLGAVLRP